MKLTRRPTVVLSFVIVIGALGTIGAIGFARPAKAVTLEVAPDYFVKLHYLLQPWVQLTNDPNGAVDLKSDFFIRRSRIILSGQVSRWVKFFMETDSPNWGKDGNWDPNFFVQDAWVEFDIAPEFKINLGMLLIPFVHQARQGATTLHTLDYHGGMVKYPAGSHQVWRDVGVEFRGVIADALDYRIAITNGVADPLLTSGQDVPRFSGRVAWNFFEPEPDYFYAGTYLGKKKVLALGLAFDLQPDVVNGTDLYYAFGADLFWDIPMGGERVSGQAAFVYYNGYGAKDAAGNAVTLDATGMGLLFDIGYAIGPWEPMIAIDWFRPTDDANDLKDQHLELHLGLAYWLTGHNANIKRDLGLVKAPGLDFGDASRVVTLQTQLLF